MNYKFMLITSINFPANLEVSNGHWMALQPTGPMIEVMELPGCGTSPCTAQSHRGTRGHRGLMGVWLEALQPTGICLEKAQHHATKFILCSKIVGPWLWLDLLDLHGEVLARSSGTIFVFWTLSLLQITQPGQLPIGSSLTGSLGLLLVATSILSVFGTLYQWSTLTLRFKPSKLSSITTFGITSFLSLTKVIHCLFHLSLFIQPMVLVC